MFFCLLKLNLKNIILKLFYIQRKYIFMFIVVVGERLIVMRSRFV